MARLPSVDRCAVGPRGLATQERAEPSVGQARPRRGRALITLLVVLLGADGGVAYGAAVSSNATLSSVAAAINLKASDVRSVLGARSIKSQNSTDTNVEVFPKACRGVEVKASGASVAFELGTGSSRFPLVSSTVFVGRSAAAVASDLASFRTSAFAQCFAARLLAPRRLTHWTRLARVTVTGGDAAGWRYSAGPPNAITIDITMLAVGRDEVFLESAGRTPIPASATNRFILLLAARAVQNSD